MSNAGAGLLRYKVANPPHAVRKYESDKGRQRLVSRSPGATSRLVLAAITSPATVPSSIWLVGISSLRVTDDAKHRARPASVHGNTRSGRGNAACSKERFRNSCRVPTASSPTGGVPPGPLGGRAAPSPLRRPPTTSSARLLPSHAGADKNGAGCCRTNRADCLSLRSNGSCPASWFRRQAPSSQ
jgi:hypothetical protein